MNVSHDCDTLSKPDTDVSYMNYRHLQPGSARQFRAVFRCFFSAAPMAASVEMFMSRTRAQNSSLSDMERAQREILGLRWVDHKGLESLVQFARNAAVEQTVARIPIFLDVKLLHQRHQYETLYRASAAAQGWQAPTPPTLAGVESICHALGLDPAVTPQAWRAALVRSFNFNSRAHGRIHADVDEVIDMARRLVASYRAACEQATSATVSLLNPYEYVRPLAGLPMLPAETNRSEVYFR
jgi:hypothetical protein